MAALAAVYAPLPIQHTCKLSQAYMRTGQLGRIGISQLTKVYGQLHRWSVTN